MGLKSVLAAIQAPGEVPANEPLQPVPPGAKPNISKNINSTETLPSPDTKNAEYVGNDNTPASENNINNNNADVPDLETGSENALNESPGLVPAGNESIKNSSKSIVWFIAILLGAVIAWLYYYIRNRKQ